MLSFNFSSIRIALNEGQRRGWFSYSDLSVLMEHRDWFHTMSQLLEQTAKVCRSIEAIILHKY